PGEVTPNIAGVRVAGVELAVAQVELTKRRPECRSREPPHEVIRRFRVQVATESLEVRGEEQGVAVVELQRGTPPTGAGAADARVCRLDLVEFSTAVRPPELQGVGGHGRSSVRGTRNYSAISGVRLASVWTFCTSSWSSSASTNRTT